MADADSDDIAQLVFDYLAHAQATAEAARAGDAGAVNQIRTVLKQARPEAAKASFRLQAAQTAYALEVIYTRTCEEGLTPDQQLELLQAMFLGFTPKDLESGKLATLLKEFTPEDPASVLETNTPLLRRALQTREQITAPNCSEAGEGSKRGAETAAREMAGELTLALRNETFEGRQPGSKKSKVHDYKKKHPQAAAIKRLVKLKMDDELGLRQREVDRLFPPKGSA